MDIRDKIFKLRGFTPVPFILVALVWAQPNYILLTLGLILSLIGETIRFNAIFHAGSETRTRNVGASRLITSGPYSVTRNPLYYGNLLMYIGYALGSAALLPWFPVIAFLYIIFQYYMIILLEEETLRELFGKEYEDYCEKVPRLFPRLFARREKTGKYYTFKEAVRSEKSTLTALVFTWALLIIRILLLPLI